MSAPSVPGRDSPRWARPVPLVGDATSAAERAASPDAWAFPPEQRAALYSLLGARRDVRRFRPDAVPEEVLGRVLAAAHTAPSVGHSQPWRFIVVRSPKARERAALCADREQLRQAALLDRQAGRQLRDLQLHGIREAPIGVVVCCDRRVVPAAVLGRATFEDADLWSCACAIENLWLAARAEGLGVGWVTLFRPAELASLVELPPGVLPMGWLCLGWPDERPPAPGLERAGWSARLALEAVVFDERWPGDTAPGAAPVTPLGAELRAPLPEAVVAARDEADELLSAPGSLGTLERVLGRLRALGVHACSPAVLVLAGADHPVTAYGVSTYPPAVTREVLEAALAGESLGATAARAATATVVVVDAGVAGQPLAAAVAARPGERRGDLVTADAMTAGDTAMLRAAGEQIVTKAAAAAAGAASAAPHRSPPFVLLGEVGIGNTTVAVTLLAALAGWSADEAVRRVGLGASGDSPTLERKRWAVRGALARARREHGERLATDPMRALASLGGPELAVLAGATLGAVRLGGAVVLDGLATSVAALLAVRLEPAVAAHLVAGQVSSETAHRDLLVELGVEPVLDLRLRAGEGVGAALATSTLRAALRMRHEAGRVRDLRPARP